MNSSKSKSWNTIQKVFLRFVLLYVVLYIFPYGFEYIHEIDFSKWTFWKTITTKFGEAFLGWEFNLERLSNGFDSKYDFSRFLLVAMISIIGALIWVFIDSKNNKDYNIKLNIFLETILRYHIGLTLILYGFSKIFILQFGEMDINRLETEIGNNNGMSFLWTFMSYSKFYGFTAGLIEVIGGLLLLFRKTTSLGGFLLLIAMANVVLMDIGYDVSVKMFAIHLLLMIVLLIRTDLKRLFHFFLGSKPTLAYKYLPLFESSKLKKIGFALKGILLLYITISFAQYMVERVESQHTNAYANLTSSQEVELFIKNGDTIPNKISNGNRWIKMNINDLSYIPETLMIAKVDKTNERFKFTADTLAQKISLTSLYGENKDTHEITYKALADNIFIYEGIFKGDTLWIQTKAKNLDDYRLIKSGTRWIRDLE